MVCYWGKSRFVNFNIIKWETKLWLQNEKKPPVTVRPKFDLKTLVRIFLFLLQGQTATRITTDKLLHSNFKSREITSSAGEVFQNRNGLV